MDDQSLLQRFVEEGSQTAFSELVQRHIDFVYSAALRQTGNVHRAQDVTQNVFLVLSAKAGSLRRRTDLAGWLYICTRHAARALGRAEARRQRAQQSASHAMTPPAIESDGTTWEQIKPHLDRLLCELSDSERRAVLLRYFHQQSYGDVAAALGLSEEATRKRVDRALDRLRVKPERRGVRSSTAALGTLLLGHGLVSAPAGLGPAILQSVGSLVGASALLPSLALFMTLTKTIIVAAAVAVAAGTGGWYVGRSTHRGTADNVVSARVAKSPEASAVVAAAPSEPVKVSAWTPSSPISRPAYYKNLIEKLRSVGLDESLVGLFVRASLQADQGHRRDELTAKLPFYRETLDPDMVASLRSFTEENRRLLQQFFDAEETIKSPDQKNGRKYAYLPVETALKVDQIQTDYAELRNRVWVAQNLSKEERAKQLTFIFEQERADLHKTMTSEQFEEYDMRGSIGVSVARVLAPTGVTDDQFRTVFRAQQTYNLSTLAAGAQERAAAQLQLADSIRGNLNDEQYFTYLGNSDPQFSSLRGVTDSVGLAPSVAEQASRLMWQATAQQKPPGSIATQLITLLGTAGADAYQKTPSGRWLEKFRDPK